MTVAAAQRAARGTLLAIGFRAVSFLATQWTLRRMNPVTLGQTAVQLEVGLALAICTAREGFRLVLTTSNTTSPPPRSVAWCTIPAGCLVALLYALYHAYGPRQCPPPPVFSFLATTSTKGAIITDFCQAGWYYSLAIVLELLAEPVVIYQLQRLHVAPKAAAESMAGLAKTIAVVVALQVLPSIGPVTAFGMAQCVYGASYSILLYASAAADADYCCWPAWKKRTSSTEDPGDATTSTTTTTANNTLWHTPTMQAVSIQTATGLVKFAITEGDRILLSTLADSYDQGVYAMASGYGGLVARLILQPTEETCRLLLSRSPTTTTAYRVYTVAVKAVVYLGLVCACLAVHYTALLLQLTAWDQHPGAHAVLTAYCVYTAVLAANGVTEAYVYSQSAAGSTTSNSGTALRLTVSHALSVSVLVALAVPAVQTYGTAGLVLANGVAMGGRVIGNVQYAMVRFNSTRRRRRLLVDVCPRPVVLLAFGMAFGITRWSEDVWKAQRQGQLVVAALQHVGIGAVCGLSILAVAFSVETEWKRQAYLLWKDEDGSGKEKGD